MKSFVPTFVMLCVFSQTPVWAQQCQTSVGSKNLVEAGKLQMSINPTQPPQQYLDEKGELMGLNVDLGRAIARKLCLDAAFIRMDTPSMIPALKVGRFDMINTGLFWTEERATMFHMVPYAKQGYGAVIGTNSTLQLQKPEDMSGLRISVEVNSYPFRLANELSKDLQVKGQKPITVQGFGNAAEALSALQAGQVDTFLTPNNTAIAIQDRRGGKVALLDIWPSQIAFAFRDLDLAQATADALTTLKADGTYDGLFDKFGMSRLEGSKFSVRGPNAKAN